ncbi:MAG: hypothetical protein EBZ61_03675 [Micrococcales bacterium]|nr:hypothetical protein [Micrococcales bacterium]
MTSLTKAFEDKPRLNRRRLNLAQDIVEGIGWLSIVWVVFTFLIDGGVTQITDLASGLSALERVSALVATMLLLIQIMLISRVPWLDKLYGHDKATQTHKKLGKPILYLVLVHFIAVIWSYSITDGLSVMDEFLTLLNTMQEIVLATIALGLMIIVVVASIKISRKKLSYEAWYLVHLLGYGAVMFAIPHQINTGTDIAGKPLAQTFWIAAYLFVALNILWFRLLSPIVSSGMKKLKISGVEAESSDSVSVTISGKNLKSFDAKSGQFFIVRFITSTLQNIRPGTRVILEGPYGIFTESRRAEDRVVLVAAGIGAPPIRALAENLSAKPGTVDIIYRVRSKTDAALLDELTEIAERRGFKLHVLEGNRRYEDSWVPKNFSSADDTSVLSQLVPKINKADVYVCGPNNFTDSVITSLKKLGTPQQQIHAEEFAW